MSRRAASLIAQIAGSALRSSSQKVTETSAAARMMVACLMGPSKPSSSAIQQAFGGLRGLSTSMRIQTSNLINVLNEEIKHENESYAKPPGLR